MRVLILARGAAAVAAATTANMAAAHRVKAAVTVVQEAAAEGVMAVKGHVKVRALVLVLENVPDAPGLVHPIAIMLVLRLGAMKLFLL